MTIHTHDIDGIPPEARRRPQGALPRIGGAAALAAALLLLLGVVGLAVPSSGLGLRNWLVVLLQINSGHGSLPTGPLHVLNCLDVTILTMVAAAFLGLWPSPGGRRRVWTAIAVALPLFGIVVLLLTQVAGRSAVMLAGIIIAVLMLISRESVLGAVGLLANALLLVADFATTDSRMPVVAAAVGVGYVLLEAWFIAIGVHLIDVSAGSAGLR